MTEGAPQRNRLVDLVVVSDENISAYAFDEEEY
jgi:hypothetical protein